MTDKILEKINDTYYKLLIQEIVISCMSINNEKWILKRKTYNVSYWRWKKLELYADSYNHCIHMSNDDVYDEWAELYLRWARVLQNVYELYKKMPTKSVTKFYKYLLDTKKISVYEIWDVDFDLNKMIRLCK